MKNKISFKDIESFLTFLNFLENNKTVFSVFDLYGKLEKVGNAAASQNIFSEQDNELISSAILDSKINEDLFFEPQELKQSYNSHLICVDDKPHKYIITVNNSILEKHSGQSLYLTQKDYNEIFSILIEDSSPQRLYSMLLSKIFANTNSSAAVLILFEPSEPEYLFHNFESSSLNKDKFAKELNLVFPVLLKVMNVNKRLHAVNANESDYLKGLGKSLKQSELLFAPCFLDNNLFALLILAKDKAFDSTELNLTEQFTFLFGFAGTLIKAAELTKNLEQRLSQKQRLETLGKLTSSISHDFSNLLSSIFGSVSLLKNKLADSPDTLRLLDNIESCSIRARDLTKGLLAYGRPTPKQKEIVFFDKLVSEITKVVNETFPPSVKFTSSVEKKLNPVMGNATQLYQVLLNLLVNAKDAVNGSGNISLSVSNTAIGDSSSERRTFLPAGDYILIKVNDDGCGIDENNLQKIFDPYFSTKTPEGLQQKESGSGLGLYISYGIIKAHKGIIDVSSQPGRGTGFEIYLPAHLISNAKNIPGSEKIILLADDEEMLQDLLAELLEAQNFYVIKVNNGKEVLKILVEEIKVDLLIIDYNMPEMNGLECIENIRKLNFSFPIILSSGTTEFMDKSDSPIEGINAVLNKPYDFETMLSLINQLV